MINILIELFKKCKEKIKDFKSSPNNNLTATTIAGDNVHMDLSHDIGKRKKLFLLIVYHCLFL
jgi:hypothetical protein